MPSVLRPRTLLTLAATLALSMPAIAQQADVRLPSLGSAADTVLSPQEAAQYGAEFLRELRSAHLVLDDPQVDQYLHALGYRLVSASADPTQHYTFTLLNVPEINSFATFGGYIFIFSGMFTVTQNQDELAAVMAHELAHVSQHHLQRALEDQQKTQPLYLLGAILASVAASRADSNGCQDTYYNPYDPSQCNNAGYGAAASVIAMMEQHQIDFTRKEEAEADHVGIDTLAKAGFDPVGMADVFAHMQSQFRPGGDGGMPAGNLPGFLQDHPVTSVRIADARARARVLDQQLKTRQLVDAADPPAPGLLPLPFVKRGTVLASRPARGPGELEYALMRERVRVLASANLRDTLAYYTRNMAANPRFAAAVANRYGHALALQQLGHADQAVPIMARLADANPGNLALALGLADAERHAGERDKALQRYASLNSMWPNDPAIVLDYSRALLDDGSKASAQTAQALLKPLLNDDSEPSLFAAYGHACHVAGDEVHAGIAYADATFVSGYPRDALDQLRRLLKRNDLDYYSRAQIEARITQITPIVLEMRRRHVTPNDPDGFGNGLPDVSRTALHVDTCAACLQP